MTASSTRLVDPLVEVDDVSVQLGSVTALDRITTNAQSGSFLGIVGPNGSGKTTLLRTITGMITPDTGRVFLAGNDVQHLSSRTRSRHLAVVPQETSVAFDFTIEDVITMGRNPYVGRFEGRQRADIEAVEEAMQRTEVTEFADRPISEVSGGERQRVLLARAIAQETPVLLLDEPTASLDIHHQIHTLDLITELVTDGKTVIAAIHDLNLAARYCDELLLLDDGRQIARGTPASVLTPKNVGDVFSVQSVITPDPITQSPRVTTYSTTRLTDKIGSIHLVPDLKHGETDIARLCTAGSTITVGPVPAGSTIQVFAESLECTTTDVSPYSPPSEQAIETITSSIAESDLTIVSSKIFDRLDPRIRTAIRDHDQVLVITNTSERHNAGDSSSFGTVISRSSFLSSPFDFP